MASSHRARTVGLFLALISAAPFTASAQSEGAQRYLTAASLHYENLDYERALDQLKKARSVSGGVDDDVTIALYEGIILSDMGKKEESAAAFREGLYLKPDAKLPVKVAPKIAEMFNATRAAVLKELEPILAKRRAEEERKKLEAEKLEQAKKAADADAEKKRLEVEKLEQAKKNSEVDAERKKLEAELALAKKAAADAKREAALLAEAQEKQRAKEEEDRRRMQQDRPEKRTLVIKDEPKPTPAFVPTVTTAPSRVPVAPFIFGGLAVAAGVVAGVFGSMSVNELSAARSANFQSETVQHLNEASRSALVANIGFGVAGGSALAAIISIFVGREAPPPPPQLQESP